MNPKIIITCAVTGAGDTVGKSPNVPVTPEQIANSALEAAAAGAAVRIGDVGAQRGRGAHLVERVRQAARAARAGATLATAAARAGLRVVGVRSEGVAGDGRLWHGARCHHQGA